MIHFKYFRYDEFEFSATAREHCIDNVIPNDNVRKNICALVGEVLEPLRELVGMPIYVTSGYRCKELNKVLKGSKNSQHMKGEAADITTNDKYGNMVMVIELLCGHYMGQADPELYGINLKVALTDVFFDFDQLIMYRQTKDKTNFAWLHVSHKLKGGNRHQVMMCHNGEYSTLDIEAQNRLVTDLAEQVTLYDNTLKCKYNPSKIQLQ